MGSLTKDEVDKIAKTLNSVMAPLPNLEHKRRFVECADHFNYVNEKKDINISQTVRRLIDEVWKGIHAKKPAVDHTIPPAFGLKAIHTIGNQHEQELLRMVNESPRLSIVGEDLSWVDNRLAFLMAIRGRITEKKTTKIFTPHPDFKPETDRDNRLRALANFVANDQWGNISDSNSGDFGALSIQLIGVPYIVPYTAIMDDNILWIKHTLMMTARYQTMWVYEKTEAPESIFHLVQADIKSLERDAERDPKSNLVERYKPT